MADQETVYYAAWLLLNDPEFIRQNGEVRLEVFPRGSLRYLVGLSLRYWQEHHTILSQTIVGMATDADSAALRRARAGREQVRKVFRDLNGGYSVAASDLPAIRQLARRWLERRSMQAAMEKAEVSIEQGDVEGARVHLDTAKLRAVGAEDTSLQITPEAEDFLAQVRRAKKGALPTGFKELDKLWEGGYRRGELGLAVAPTGIGKSMYLCYLAAKAFWVGASVQYHTFELSPAQIRDRIALGILEKGKRDTRETWVEELRDKAKRRGLSQPPAAYIDIRNDAQTWPAIVASLEEFKREQGKYPALLLVDSADDVAPIKSRDAQWQQLLETFVFLRALAREKRIRIWTSGQLTREAVDRARVNLKHVGNAFAKAQKAHYVLGFAQTDQQRTDDMGQPKMSVYVLKDSVHGTNGGWLECEVTFGRGDNGYPGWEVDATYGLPVTSG